MMDVYAVNLNAYYDEADYGIYDIRHRYLEEVWELNKAISIIVCGTVLVFITKLLKHMLIMLAVITVLMHPMILVLLLSN